MKFFLLLSFIGLSLAQWDPNFTPGRAGIVHLFEWEWDTIADECEQFLAPNKFAGVQISPPNENRIVGGQWWERYQPVSYILKTRGGDREAFSNMVDRCNAVGVHIYADTVINHMCGDGGSGTGTAGSYFDTATESFPGVPFTAVDFNDGNCNTTTEQIEDYKDVNQVRECQLWGLLDLNQGSDHVRDRIITFMDDLIDLGVAGFRIDATKHMWPEDLDYIFSNLKDLSTEKGFSSGRRPFVYQEVIDQGGEPITASQYFGTGRVTEFNYGLEIAKNRNQLQYLENFVEEWDLVPDNKALVFLSNHDNQRGHGGGGSVITFKDEYELKIFNAFMMAYLYGVPRIMSSYYFSDSDQGPPPSQRSILNDGLCGNGWVCEHRWRQITNMVAFAAAVEGTKLTNWWRFGDNQIAFSREDKGFLAINKASYSLNKYLQTGLPAGAYCNVISGDYSDGGGCTGECVSVDDNGYANIYIPQSADPVVALHVNAPCTSNSGNSGSSEGQVECSTCDSCSQRTDCGYQGINQRDCEGKGCLWCPSYVAGVPSCVEIFSNNGGDGSPTCDVNDSSKQDCGYFGVDQTSCEKEGCCWNESNDNSDIPWCYYPA